MSYPDLMLTKAVALRRQEQQQACKDPYAGPLPGRIYRSRQVPAWLRRAQYSAARQLVRWGERLQAYNASPRALAAGRSPKSDCFETIQVRR